MFRSTTIVGELAVEPGLSYIDIKTFSKVVIRWCGSMSQRDVCTVCCAEYTPPNNNLTECLNINITLARLNCKLPDDGRRPKHAGAI